jgi:hypothetical protein
MAVNALYQIPSIDEKIWQRLLEWEKSTQDEYISNNLVKLRKQFNR